MFNRPESGGLVHGAWCGLNALRSVRRDAKVPNRIPAFSATECQPTNTRQIFCGTAVKPATSLKNLIKMKAQPFT